MNIARAMNDEPTRPGGRQGATVTPLRPERPTDRADDTASRLAACLVAVGARADREAFRTLFLHYAPRLKALMIRSGAGPQEAEEVMQETMAIIWRKAALFDPAKASASTWIYTVARNRRYDLLRRENRPALDPEDPFFSGGSEPDGEEVYCAEERAEIIRSHLETLPEEQLLLVRKAFFEDMTHQAIAAELDMPLGTVKSRIRIAMRSLREKLDGVEL
jgi:RNA polymerase sigma factor (sigma-70 family)